MLEIMDEAMILKICYLLDRVFLSSLNPDIVQVMFGHIYSILFR